MQFVLKSINFYRAHSRWTLQYPSSATACWSYCPRVTGALASQSLDMVNVAGSYYPRELPGSDNLGMLFPLRTRNHFLISLMFEKGHLCCPNWRWQLCLMSLSQLVKKKNHCSVSLALQFLTLCQWRIRWGVIMGRCRESLDKIFGKKSNPFKQEELRNPGRGCLGRSWWNLWKLRPLRTG